MSEPNAEAGSDPADEWDTLPPAANELFGLVGHVDHGKTTLVQGRWRSSVAGT